jgi:cysteinyl-tRNA synthetase
VDIHGGGNDLVFPHHESEIAQAEASDHRAPFVRYWMHVGMACLEGVKMSKSLGNMVFVRDLLRDFSADGIRLYLLGEHYRESMNFSRKRLEEMDQLADRLRRALGAATGPASEGAVAAGIARQAMDALGDDLATPRAISGLARLVDLVLQAPEQGADAAAGRARLRALTTVLGLRGEA